MQSSLSKQKPEDASASTEVIHLLIPGFPIHYQQLWMVLLLSPYSGWQVSAPKNIILNIQSPCIDFPLEFSIHKEISGSMSNLQYKFR